MEGRLRRAALAAAAVILPALLVFYTAGYFLFTRPHGDLLGKADAIVVLGGDKDGRIDYGLDLARQGYADTVVISNSYDAGDPTIARACASGTATITVICFRPSPFTTRGEAMFVERAAAQQQWKHVIVVSWNFHLIRARYIFHQCFDGTVTMRPAPHVYPYDLVQWTYIYAYQFGGLVKAVVLGCAGA
ncbi:YdcF family protein [Mycolicibacterium komossense]|uniref:YdcF family protein n=1 Tax=Mycolicibacterium komossense TaxID=1779 RepID=UPI0021F31F6E|nr:YdcF family protein [Mycolicibacterium komossense]